MEVKLENVFRDVIKEVNRITTEAHPDYQKNSMGKWLTVIGEEQGEICRALLEKQGKNLYTEAIQVMSALYLMLKKAEKLHLLGEKEDKE